MVQVPRSKRQLFGLMVIFMGIVLAWGGRNASAAAPYYAPKLLPSVADAIDKLQILAPSLRFGRMTGAQRITITRSGVLLYYSHTGVTQKVQYFWSWNGGYNAPVTTPYEDSATFTLVYKNLDWMIVDPDTVIFCTHGSNDALGLNANSPEEIHTLADAMLTLAVAGGSNNIFMQDISFDDLSRKELKRLHLDNAQRIISVFAGGPAEQAGLQTGDILLSINAKPTTGIVYLDTIYSELQAHPEGATLHLDILRNGAPLTLDAHYKPLVTPQAALALQTKTEADAKAAEAKAAPAGSGNAPSSGVKLGIQARPVTDEDARTAHLQAARGVLVVGIEKGSLAESMKLAEGDIILEVNGTPIGESNDFRKLLLSGPLHSLTVWRAAAELHMQAPESF